MASLGEHNHSGSFVINFSEPVVINGYTDNGVEVANGSEINGDSVTSQAFNLSDEADSNTDNIEIYVMTSRNTMVDFKATFNTSTGRWILNTIE